MKNTRSKNGEITKQMVRQMITSSRLANAELKSYAMSANAQNPFITGAVYALSQALVLGDGYFARDGAQVTVKVARLSVNVRTVSSSSVRFIVVQDTMNTGVLPAVTDILRTANVTSGYSQVITNEQKRMKIVSDKTYDLSTNGVMNLTHVVTANKLARTVTYLGDTDTSASNGRNSFFLLVIGSTTIPFFDFDWNMRFLDQ